MKQHTNKHLRRALALFMTVLMVMSCFSAGLSALAAIDGLPTRDNKDSFFSDTTLYGAEKWDKTTDAASLTFNWNAYSGSLGYDPQPGTLTFSYPGHIYLNVGETLEAAGYMGHMTASYGENEGDATDFRVMLSSATWGESTRAGFSPISSLISGYSHQGTVTEGTKIMTGSSSHYDFSNDGRGSDQIIGNKSGDNENFLAENESIVVWRSNIKLTSPGLTNFDEYVLLKGTAAKTGEVTFNPTQNFTIGAAQRYTSFAWHSDNGTRFNRYTMNGGSRPQTTPAENALSMTFTVYDKSELARLVAAIDNGSLTADATAIANARAILADREVTQDQIDAAATAIGDKMTILVNQNEPNYTSAAADTWLGTEKNTFNAPAFHYSDDAMDGYANVVWATQNNTVVGESGYHDNYYQLDRARMKVFTPASIVLVRDGVTTPKMPAVFEMVQESFVGFDWVKYYHLRSVSDQMEMAGNWIGYNEGNDNGQWEQWPKDHITDSTLIYGSYSDEIYNDYAHRNTGTPRFFWNAVNFNTPANTDTYYNIYNQLVLEAKVRTKGAGWGSGTEYTSSFTDRVNDHDRQHCYSANFNAYVINYEPIYTKLSDAAAVKAIIEGDTAWQYTEASVKRAKATIAAMIAANPKNFFVSGGPGVSNATPANQVGGKVSDCAGAIKDAKYMLDNDGLTLEKKTGTVTFVDQLGNTVLINNQPATYTKNYGETIAANEIPQLSNAYYRTDNAQWDYSETLSWDPALPETITVDEPEKIFRISDEQTVQTYTVTFYDEDGTTVLKSEDWQYGDYPVWGSDEAPTKAASAQKTYKFDHWVDPAGNEYALNGVLKAFVVETLEGSTRADLNTDAMKKYTAVFVEDQDVTYPVTIIAGANTTLTVKNGDAVVNSGEAVAYGTELTIEAAADAAYTQHGVTVKVNGEAFTGTTYTVTGNTTITTDAIEETDINKYAVTISVGENTTLTVKNGEAVLTSGAEVPHGTVLTIEAAPTDGYSQQGVAVVKVNGEVYADATCTVTGDTAITTDPIDASQINTYTVTWKVDDAVVETDTGVTYGSTPSYDGAPPTKTDPTGAVTYTFTGWDGDINAAVYADTVFNAVFSETLNFDSDDIEDAIAEKLTGILNDEGDLPYGECYTEATLNAFYAAYMAVMDFEGEPKTDENVNALAAALDDLLAAAQALVVEHDWQDNWVGGHTHPHYDPEGLSTTNPAVNNKVCANDPTHTETVEINGATHYTEGDPNYADLYTQLNGLIALCTDADISAATEQALTEAFMALAAVGLDYTDSDEDEAALVEALNAAKVKIDALQTLVDADRDGVLDDGALKTYTITWSLEGGTSDSTTVTSGATPSHADDTKEATHWYTFNFDGWSPALTPATADATYTSTFSKTPTQALTDLIAAAQGIAANASDYDDTYQDEIDQIEDLLDKYPDAITEEDIETLKDLVDEADAFVLYTITFVTYSIDIWPITAKVGSVVDLPDSAKDGYHFGGWYTDETFADGTKVTSPYTLTGDVTLYAFFEELSLNGDDVEAAIAAATAGVSGICYTEASYTAYTDAIAAVRAFKDQSATTENLTAYNNALSALDAAVAGLVEEHAYTGEPAITRPVQDAETGVWSKGVKTWTCANETSHPVKTEEVDRADYTTYDSVLDQISDLLDEDLTDDVKSALETAKTALEEIPQNYIEDEQATLDDAIQTILDTLKGNDKIDVDDDDTITVDPDTAYKTYTLKIYNNVNTDYMEFTHKAGTTARLNPGLAGYTLKGFSANDNYNDETGIYTFPKADDTITALFVKDLTDNETIEDAQQIIADETNPDSGKDYDDDYIDDLNDLLDEIDAIKDDPTKLDELNEKLEDLQELVDKAEENRAYTITWSIDGAETTEIYKIGATPTHADPVKDGFNFNGWDPAIAAVTADATYTAVFTEISDLPADYTEYDALFEKLGTVVTNDVITDELKQEAQDKLDHPLDRDLTADQQQIIDDEVAAIKAILDKIFIKDGNGDYTDTVKDSAAIHCNVVFHWLDVTLTKTVVKGNGVSAPDVNKMYGVEGEANGHYVFDKWDKDFSNVTEDIDVYGSYKLADHTGPWIEHAATCSHVAYKEITCTTCGLHFEVNTGTEKADHDWNAWVVSPATCAHPGSQTRTCKNDPSHTEFEVLPQLAHTDANGDTICDVCGNPTENHQHTDQNGDGKCDSCGAPTDAHVHNYQNGVCTGCGQTQDGSFRCNMCPVWERYRGTPVLGWFLTAIHFFYHLICQIISWR